MRKSGKRALGIVGVVCVLCAGLALPWLMENVMDRSLRAEAVSLPTTTAPQISPAATLPVPMQELSATQDAALASPSPHPTEAR